MLWVQNLSEFQGIQQRTGQSSRATSFRGLSSPLCLKRQGVGTGSRETADWRRPVGMSHGQPLVEENHHSNLAGREQETKPLGLPFSHLHLLLRLLLADGNQKPRHKGALIAVLKSVSWTQITCRRLVGCPLEPSDDICPTCEEAQHVNSMAHHCMGDSVALTCSIQNSFIHSFNN